MIPTPLWIVLFFISVVVFAYMLFFADPSEGAVTQAMLMGAVTAVLTVLLLLLVTLDRPYQSGVGGVKPAAMERSLDMVSRALTAIDARVVMPCDANGVEDGLVTGGRTATAASSRNTIVLTASAVATAVERLLVRRVILTRIGRRGDSAGRLGLLPTHPRSKVITTRKGRTHGG